MPDTPHHSIVTFVFPCLDEEDGVGPSVTEAKAMIDDLGPEVPTDAVTPLMMPLVEHNGDSAIGEVLWVDHFGNLQLNLDALDADIAVRPTRNPPDQLVGRRICDVAFALYAATDLKLNLEMTLDGMGSRYLMPVMACVTCWIALAVDEWWESRENEDLGTEADARVLAEIEANREEVRSSSEANSALLEAVRRSLGDSPDSTGFTFATPDGKGSFRLRASIRLNGAWDFSGLRSTDVFDTYLIPVGTGAQFDQARFFMQATQSRFGSELNRDTGTGIVFGRIETDFRGEGNSLRLRHAYGEYWRMLAGQTWSTFTDVTTLPVTVDLEGPPSSNSVRTPQIRYTVSPAEGWNTAIALEAPNAGIASLEIVDSSEGAGRIARLLLRGQGEVAVGDQWWGWVEGTREVASPVIFSSARQRARS